MRNLLVTLMLVVAPVSLIAQNWEKHETINPMTDEKFHVYTLLGTILDKEHSFALITLKCSNGKFDGAFFSTSEKTFYIIEHNSFVPDAQGPFGRLFGDATSVFIRFKDAIENRTLILSSDPTLAHIVGRDMSRITKDGTVVIQFTNVFSESNYAKLTDGLATPEIKAECGW